MRKRLLVGCVVCIAAGSGFGYWLIHPFYLIHELAKRYQQVRPGMAEAEVEAIMGGPGNSRDEPGRAWWDDEYLGAEASVAVVKETLYTVSTFYLPVSFASCLTNMGEWLGATGMIRSGHNAPSNETLDRIRACVLVCEGPSLRKSFWLFMVFWRRLHGPVNASVRDPQ